MGSIGRQGIKGDAGAKVSVIAASSKSLVQDYILLLVLHVCMSTLHIPTPLFKKKNPSFYLKGQKGAPGLPGATGAAGLRGLKGLPGHAGEKGIRGQPGEKGITGQDGEDVSNG